MAADLRKAVREFPEVSYVVTQLGRNDDGTDPWTPSHIEASVGLHPYNTWPAGETKQDLIRRMAAKREQTHVRACGGSAATVAMSAGAIITGPSKRQPVSHHSHCARKP
jgi:Cu/Ag efflux pump CusA